MSSLTPLLSHLRQRDIKLWTEEGRLRFDAPLGAMTDQLKLLLKANKKELIGLLEASGGEQRVPPIVAAANDGQLNLSQQQERLWFLDRLVQENRAYNIPAFFSLSGEISVRHLEQAFSRIQARHESLRTVFPENAGRPRQVVLPPSPVRLPLVDLSGLEAGTEELTRRLLEEEARSIFFLAEGPLLRIRLIRLGRNQHLLVVNMHHIISDRWSTGILLAELGQIVGALEEGKEAQLPALPVQYRDYTRWQRQILEHALISQQVAYWRQQLSGDLPVLELSISRARSGPMKFEGDAVHFQLSPSVSDALRALARRERATLFMLLLAVYKVLLYRYSGQRDLLVGTPIAGRNDPALEGLIGFFANTLVLRDRVRAGASFSDFLQEVKGTAVQAFDNQDVSFERVVEAVNPERDVRQNPLFQIVFVLNTDEMPTMTVGSVQAEPVVLDTNSAKFDLLLALQDEPRGISGFLEFDVELFARGAVERFRQHFQALVESVLEIPHRPLDDLSILTEGERHQILGSWNDTEVPYSSSMTLHQLFEAQVARAPDASAALCRGESLTYREVNRRANRIAHFLRDQGVGPDVMVGVCFRRSLHMIPALLGVLKAGGAYVPIDPSHPQQRAEYILDCTGASTFLTQAGVFSDLDAGDVRTVRVDDEDFSSYPETNPVPLAKAGNLAYVIFTSGSTGHPKGVILQHRPVVNLIEWVNTTFHVGNKDRLLFITSLCFDLSVYDVFGVLAGGGEIYIASEEELADPALLAQVLCEEGITFWDSAPAALQQLAPFFYPGRGKSSSLRLVFLSGDWIPLSLPPTMKETFPDCRFVGLGGATEAAIWSNYFVVESMDPAWKSVPYGMPIQNARYYTLDQKLNLCPVEMPGDLFIGDRCLSFGYFGQPALTAQRYIPDPYSREPGGVLYRTGDRALRMADGNLEFLGRLDEQVKIRGFRIELGEIEAVLQRHPALVEAKVLARELRAGEKSLVAYLQLFHDERSEAQREVGEEELFEELSDWLRQSLPEYMVPSAFVTLEDWPVTANGKLDRRALPKPELVHRPATLQELATPLEKAVAHAWKEVLGVDAVGANDNFFDLGGHSLLATQLISALRDRLSVELPLRDLFAFPTVAGLASCIEEARQNLSHLTPLLVPLPRSGSLPLSFSQERMWFLHRLDPQSGVYNIPAALRLRGALDRLRLVQALKSISLRQESLRTSFPTRDGVPVQIISEVARVHLPVVDLSALRGEIREVEALRIAEKDAGAPFAMEDGPLFRTTLLQLTPVEHIILLNLHHIVSDGWSTGVMLREFVHFYNRAEEGAALPSLGVQYADYAVWQRKRLAAGDLDGQLEYWRRQLAGIPPALELPTDRPRQGAFRFVGGAYRWLFPQGLMARLRPVLQREDVTLFIFLLSAFMVLLSRHSGQRDVVVGSPVANRNRSETEGLIGLFVNTLVFRGLLSGRPTFGAFLRAMKEVAVAAYDHQDLPFEKLVEGINPDRDLSRNPLFQIVFMVQNAPTTGLELEGLGMEVVPVENATAKFDLTMDLAEEENDLVGRVEFNADTFDATSIQRMMAQYSRLLESVAVNPDQAMAQTPLLSSVEEHQLLREWNDTEFSSELSAQSSASEAVSMHGLFEAQAVRRPEQVAAMVGDEEITYGELNRRANGVARFLMERGVERGSLVGVCFPRCLEMVVGLLGVLKTGAAYVPLDPAYPRERMEFILQGIEARFVLTQSLLEERLRGLGAEVVAVDRETFPGASHTNLDRRILNEDLAYIIFTSGSTGQPKGVVLQHGPVVNLIRWVNETFSVGPQDRLLFLTSLCFDLSVYDVFGTLAAGGTVVIAADDQIGNPQSLLSLLEEKRITFWDSAPAALQQLAPLFPAAGTGSRDLRLVFLSGDWIPLSLPPAVAEAYENARVIGLGGATEAAIWSNFFPVGKIDPHWRSVPYGRPIRNAHYHVLDETFRPAPLGVAGDLYIGDACLSFCYFKQPRQSALSYRPDPFSDRSGGVLYRTGDRARRFPDGTIEFLGRLDHQVKIRGFRIELGEIEAVLRQAPEVEEAIVLAREDRPGDKQLAAYVELAEGVWNGEEGGEEAHRLTESLRRALKDRLPEYMVPLNILLLREWPVTSNGKLDRKALPEPGEGVLREATEAAAARTSVEEMLVGLWADVLDQPEVGIHDDFFELGGHSVLIAQVVGRIRGAFGVELPMRKFFDHPTVAELASVVQEELDGPDKDPRPPLTRLEDRGELPLSYAQERLWLQTQLQGESGAYNVPVAMRLEGPLNADALCAALVEIFRRHESLRSVFEAQGSEVVLRAPTWELAVERLDLTTVPAQDREAEMLRLAEAEAEAPFDLETGPLMRAKLLHLAPELHVVVVTVHHIVFDGLSVGVLIRELQALYQAYRKGEASPLASPTFQYADYTAWQRRWLQGEVLERQLSFWQDYLAGAPTHLEIPSPKPRPAVMSDRGAVVPFHLAAQETEKLIGVARRQGSTLFMTLLAAFKVLLFHWTRQRDLVVGTDAAGRAQEDLEPMIGFFVNQLALRSSLDGDPSFVEILKRVRKSTLDAFQHQDAPFHKIVERLQPPRDRSRTPVVQLKLVYQDTPSSKMALDDLKLEELLLGGRAVKFDLWLNVWPDGGGLSGRLEYNRDVLARGVVERLLRQFALLLATVAESPEMSLTALDDAIRGFAVADQKTQLRSVGKALFRKRSGARSPS